MSTDSEGTDLTFVGPGVLVHKPIAFRLIASAMTHDPSLISTRTDLKGLPDLRDKRSLRAEVEHRSPQTRSELIHQPSLDLEPPEQLLVLTPFLSRDTPLSAQTLIIVLGESISLTTPTVLHRGVRVIDCVA